MHTRPRYRLTPPPNGPKTYGPYLDMYGSAYGDMSDPAQRADTIRALRRRDALSLAAARREEWRTIRATPTDDLHHELRVKRYQIEHCADVRPWNIRNCDVRTFRLIWTELTRRTWEN